MTPETPPVVVLPPEPAAALEETEATLDSIAEQIESESEISRDRADEMLREVRECRSTVNQLSQLIPTLQQQTESPSMQQALIQLTALQTAVEKLQTEVEALRGSNRSEPEPVIAVAVPSANPDGPKGSPASPSHNEPATPTSNQSATPPPPEPKKKRYVKI